MKRFYILAALLTAAVGAMACTSMIVTARASASGRPLLWKHRDTGADNNFLAKVEATDSTYAYVGLFNAGDSLLSEAWMGMNERGFAIMNTASYNLAPDTAQYKDREAEVMSQALARCTTVADFERLLSERPHPMGVQANFGVIDASGGAAYFEAWDDGFNRFDVENEPTGVMIRTNYSVSGVDGRGYGYIRYATAERLTAEAVASGAVTPMLFTETLSRSFYHGLTGHDYLAEGERYVADYDFIPRDISTSSIVVEGVADAKDAADMRMWAVLGYPPCSPVEVVTLDSIPEQLQPSGDDMRSEACDRAMELRRTAIPFEGGNGRHYLDLNVLRPIIERMHEQSMKIYEKNYRTL